MNLDWFKKHPYSAGAAVLVGLIVIYFLMKRGSSSGSGSGFAGLMAQQNQGQLQLATLNAQQSAQEQQLQAQLAAQEYQGNLAAQEQQNQLVYGLGSSIIPAQLQMQTMLASQKTLSPYIASAVKEAGTPGSGREEAGLAALGLLMGEGNIGQIGGVTGAPSVFQQNPLNTFMASLGSGASTIGTGLFGAP